ncbi:MAG: ATP-dependent DNA helicase [Flavobacteriaceae bacterium]
MDRATISSFLEKKFSFTPTLSQASWFPVVATFLASKESSAFVLKGYAGTGKTTLIAFLVQQLEALRCKGVLMAPTGRAAKIVSQYAGQKAYTIHKQIYYPKSKGAGGIQFQLKPNRYKSTIFIVDEASMIGDDAQQSKLFENGSLLDDLVQYVQEGHQCKLLLVGDTAQLPPVHLDRSPALDEHKMEHYYFDQVLSTELSEVVRQAQDSGILFNATQLREQLQQGFFESFQFTLSPFTDLKRLQSGDEILEALQNAYDEVGKEETALIVRSNKRASLYNQNIRHRILFLENHLAVGDQLMVVKNNYFWLSPDSQPGFIANGDLILIKTIHQYKSLYGFSFAEVNVQLVDYPEEPTFDTTLLLDTLDNDQASLSYEQSQALYQAVMEDYVQETTKYKRLLKVKSNPFFNALQVKYSYAITCHKAQGGQWKRVFIEQPYLPEGMNKDFFRWLYTALTRAKERVYLIGFTKSFFNNN